MKKQLSWKMLLGILLCVLLFGLLSCGLLQLTWEQPDALSSDEVLPISASWKEEDGQLLYTKEYHLTNSEQANTLNRESFQEDGIRWTFLEQLEEVQEQTMEKAYEHSVTFESTSNRMEVLLGMLDPKKDITTDDGYQGIVYLDHQSIQAIAKGYGTKSVPKRTTRQYPNLDAADVSYLPKTVTEDGVICQLKQVDWQNDQAVYLDGYEMPCRYTAIASYEGTVSKQYATGYTVQAVYRGNLEKTEVQETSCHMIFLGERISFFEQAPVKVSGCIALLLLLTVLSIMGYRWLTVKRNSRKTVEESW